MQSIMYPSVGVVTIGCGHDYDYVKHLARKSKPLSFHTRGMFVLADNMVNDFKILYLFSLISSKDREKCEGPDSGDVIPRFKN